MSTSNLAHHALHAHPAPDQAFDPITHGPLKAAGDDTQAAAALTAAPGPVVAAGYESVDRRFLLGGLAGAAGIAALAAMTGRASAGPLNPPAGAVAGTGKSLTDVEPRIAINSVNTPGSNSAVYRITQPGSYYLTENLTGVAGKSGIFVFALGTGATIDLNGFEINGGLRGIEVDSGIGAVIRNGSIRSTLSHGIIFVNGNASPASLIENVAVQGAGGSGILPGANSIVRGCSANGCTAVGISAGYRGIVECCTATGNTNGGIYSGSGAAIIRGCNSSDNPGPGILLSSSGNVACENLVRSNGTGATRAGIRVSAGTGNLVERNTLVGNNTGIECAVAGNIVRGNTVFSGTGNAFELVANNRYGQIVNLTGASAAVSGNAAASVLATTDPHANFVY